MSFPFILGIRPPAQCFRAGVHGYHPAGLLYLLGMLRKCGYRVGFLDFCFDGKDIPRSRIDPPLPIKHFRKPYYHYGLTFPSMKKKLKEIDDSPVLILVTSGITYWYPALVSTLKAVRDVFPGVPVALGGTYATLEYDHALSLGYDHVCCGEGELWVLDLAARITGIQASVDFRVSDLSTYPLPAWDMAPIQSHPDYGGKWLPVYTSRGCPRACSYCASGLIYNFGFRQNAVSSVISELYHYYKELGVRNFVFWDENLLVNKDKHIKPILDGVLSLGLDRPMTFMLPNSTDAAQYDQELCALFRRAKFRKITLSIEVLERAALEKMGRTTDGHAVETAIKMLHAAGYDRADIRVYILVGLPGQRYQAVIDTVMFIWRCGAIPVPLLFTPIRGTGEHKKLLDRGIIPDGVDPLLLSKDIIPCQSNELTYEDVKNIRAFTNRVRTAIYMDADLYSNNRVMSYALDNVRGVTPQQKTISDRITAPVLSSFPASMRTDEGDILGYIPEDKDSFTVADLVNIASSISASTLRRFDDLLEPTFLNRTRLYSLKSLKRLELLIKAKRAGLHGDAVRDYVKSLNV